MQPIHLAIGLIEGLVTSAVLLFIYEMRPELLMDLEASQSDRSRCSLKTTVLILAIVAAVVGGGVSLLASSNPDGLEWSIEKLTGSTEIEGAAGSLHQAAGALQEATSILPDYAFKGSESVMGTAVSGMIGAVVVVAVCVGVCSLIKHFRKRKQV